MEVEGEKGYIFDVLMFSARTLLAQVRLVILTLLIILGVGAGIVVFAEAVNIPLLKVLHAIGSLHTMAQQPASFFQDLFLTHWFSLLIASVLFFLWFVWVEFGRAKLELELCDKGCSSVRAMFTDLHLLPKAMLAYALYFLLCILGGLFFLLPGIILYVRLALFMYFIIDKNAGVIESFKGSYRLIQGYTWELFGLLVISQFFGRFYGVGNGERGAGAFAPLMFVSNFLALAVLAAFFMWETGLVYAKLYRSLGVLESDRPMSSV